MTRTRCFVDTSVLLRYLTGDAPAFLSAAKRIVDEVSELFITEGTLAETAYVLSSFYQVPREQVVDSLIDLLRKENLRVHNLDKGIVIQALSMCRPSGRVSFADAFLWAIASQADAGCVYSFDRRFPSEGIEVRSRL